MSKRANIFEQGKPERPYNEREEGPVETPQRATAAQMAARKIKTLKGPRRAQGGSSGLSQSTSFAMPAQTQSSGFNFGATAPIGNSSTNTFGFSSQQPPTSGGGAGAFGSNATNSFPPAQTPAPTNSFVNSSFPSFGGDNANSTSAFNPQPPSATFNFSAGGANPFAASTPASATKGAGQGGFAGSIFNIPPAQSQPASSLFAFPSASQDSNPITKATSSTIFGTSTGPSSNMFGAISSGPNSSNITATAAPSSNFFSSNSSTPSTPIFNFAATTQSTTTAPESTSTPAQSSSLFKFGGPSAQNKAVTESAPTPAQSTTPFKFGLIQKSTATESAPIPAPSATPFVFGPTTQEKPDRENNPRSQSTPQSNAFGATNASTPAPKNSLFSPSTSSPSSAAPTNSFSFGSTVESASKVPESQAQPNIFNFSSSKPSINTGNAAPKSNPFGSLGTLQPAPSSSLGLFGQLQQSSKPEGESRNSLSAAVEYPSLSVPPKTNEASFSFTPQKSFGTSTNNDSTPTPPFPPPQASPSNPFAGLARSPSPSKEPAPKANPFANLQQSSAKASTSTPPPTTPTSAMPTLTGAAAPPTEAPKANGIPKLATAHVPASWASASTTSFTDSDQTTKSLVDLATELSALNQKFREKINNLPPMADWGALSAWHQRESSEITKKIVATKKHQAVAKGVTGYESTLSTKRKVNDETTRADAVATTPTKRFRGHDDVSTPPPQPPVSFSTTPKADPPVSQTSNLFGNIIKNAPTSTPVGAAFAGPPVQESSFGMDSTSDTNASGKTSFFVPPTTSSLGVSSKNGGPSSSNFQVPHFGSPSSSRSNNDAVSKLGFQPPASSNTLVKDKSNPTHSSPPAFKVPSFGASGASFACQFAKKSKTQEQLAAERKKKAFEEDYDSDDETPEAWEARYDEQEATRKAEENKKIKAAEGFKISVASKDSSNGMPTSNVPFFFANPTSGTSTPGLFSSRAGSPAPSTTGGLSVFDTPPVPHNQGANIFGHLSSGPSSNNQDESSDEDDGKQAEGKSQSAQPTNSDRSSPPRKSKIVERDSGSESEETLEETMRRKQQEIMTPKPSLLSRMTRADDNETSTSDANKMNNQTSTGTPIFGLSNGMQTPTRFPLFNFDAAVSQTVPAKDHTFKQGTPIKFGGIPATETKNMPTFQFQPATPSPAEFSATPTKTAPFSFLSAGNLQSGPGSSSGLSSRAGTPSSEIDASGKDSAAETDDEDGTKSSQLDLSDLTDAEREEYDVVFHTELAIAKRQALKDDKKVWENFARGPLWILENKKSGKSLVRMRIPSGATPVNYNLLPKLHARVTGASKKMVLASFPGDDGKLSNIFFAHKNQEVAEEFADAYNSHLPPTK